jgi:ABC-type transporter Mla subunit MlaD
MRRALAILAILGAGTVAVLGTGAGNDDSGTYEVRAIFQNAFSLVPGEDVKIAGVKVGKIKSLDVTAEQQAAVVLAIDTPGFKDFRSDAECTIRPQSLIGEKFVECTPTQPRPAGENPPPELKKVPDGQPGAGQRLLPVEQTSRPVDIDLVNNVMRLPYRQRLGIIINEFGTGLAGRGQDLREVIRNADPALKSTDKVLKLLAEQNKVLADLARDSDVTLGPLARERKHVAGFIEQANTVARATAERRGAFEQQFAKLPTFLRELRPTMERLGGFADQATPVLRDLGDVAPQVSRFVKALGPFSASSTVALKSLGKATIPGRKALKAAQPIVSDLRDFGAVAEPLSSNLSALLTSLRDTGGIERLMDYIFYQVAAINGYDSFGHYLRAELIVNLCSTYATPDNANASCSANFQEPARASAARNGNMTAEQALHQEGRSLYLRRMDAILRGMSPQEAIAKTKDEESGAKPTAASSGGTGSAAAPEAPATSNAQTDAALAAALSRQQSPAAVPGEQLLDYLLGGGA